VHTAAPLRPWLDERGRSQWPARARPRWPTDRPAGRVRTRFDSLLRRDAFQRACVTLAWQTRRSARGQGGQSRVTCSRTMPERCPAPARRCLTLRVRSRDSHEGLAPPSHRHRSGKELRVAACSLPSCTLGRRKGGLPGPRVGYGESQSESSTDACGSSKRPRQERRRTTPSSFLRGSTGTSRCTRTFGISSRRREDAPSVGFRAVGRLSSGWRVFDRKGFTDLCASVEPPEEAARTVQISSPRTAGCVGDRGRAAEPCDRSSGPRDASGACLHR